MVRVMSLYYTDLEMMKILIRDYEARKLEKYFNITLPPNPTISAHTVMRVLRTHYRTHDHLLLQQLAEALKHQGIRNRSAAINYVLEVIVY